MLRHIVDKTEAYTKGHCKDSRKHKGQFFTPLLIAKYMAKCGAMYSEHLSILEPGAGNGILSASLIAYCIDNNMCRIFSLDLIENDIDILPLLRETVELLEQYVRSRGGELTVNLYSCNYLTDEIDNLYDIVICNPPYKKIRKDSNEARSMAEYVHGQPNLYSLFMAKGINNLSDGAKFVFITPRSWTSGSYYKCVREYVLDNLNITDLVLFEDRDNVFDGEDVLQETLITVGVHEKIQDEYVNIYHTHNMEQQMMPISAPKDLIKGVGHDNYLLLPTNENDLQVIRNMAEKSETFESLGYCFKTGPVVEFRNKGALSSGRKNGYVPMFRSANIVNGRFIFPASTNKAQYVDAAETKLLLSNANTVFLRRLSAKEESRRLQSCVYYGNDSDDFISVENHVNYLVHTDGSPLTEDEAEWIHELLMSEEYDTYYRLINGSTQVNASEINQLPLERRA